MAIYRFNTRFIAHIKLKQVAMNFKIHPFKNIIIIGYPDNVF